MSADCTEAEVAARDVAVRRATAALARLVPDESEREAYAESVERYADAVALGAKLRCEWDELGRPSLASGSAGQPTPHPLVRMIAEADAAAAKYATHVGLDASTRLRRPPGRPVASASAPDRAAAPPRVRRLSGGGD